MDAGCRVCDDRKMSPEADAARLVAIDQSNWRAALQVRVNDEQLVLVADHQPVALVVLSKAYVQPGGRRWEPLAYIGETGEIVAVLALAHSADVAEVVNLAVDTKHQGKGIGMSVMIAVLGWCRAQHATSVELTVDPANDVAMRLYDRVGFRPTGETRDGDPVWAIPL